MDDFPEVKKENTDNPEVFNPVITNVRHVSVEEEQNTSWTSVTYQPDIELKKENKAGGFNQETVHPDIHMIDQSSITQEETVVSSIHKSL